MIQYLRKLDLLNRFFIFKYGDLSLLENPCIFKLPEMALNSNKNNAVFNLSDVAALLRVLTKKRTYYVAQLVLLDLIKSTNDIFLDSKLLLKLKKYYPKNLFNDLNNDLMLQRPWLVESLKTQDIEFILDCMVSGLVHHPSSNKVFYRDRGFVLNKILDQELIKHLTKEDLENRFMQKLNIAFPALFESWKMLQN